MNRATVPALSCLSAFLLLLPLALPKPGQPYLLKADEPAYYLMALSLAHDRDLRVEEKDIGRLFEEFPFRPLNNLIVMSDDGWRTIFYSKPLPYPFFAAPFAAVLGGNGILVFNMLLLLSMVWLGALHLSRTINDLLAATFSVGFFLFSTSFAYAFWIHSEVFNMAAIMAAFYLVLSESSHSRLSLIRSSASGAALALAAYNKPMFALLALPLLVHLAKGKRWRGPVSWLLGAALSGGFFIGLSQTLTGRPSPYIGGQERAGVSVCEPNVLPIKAAPQPTAVDDASGDGAAEDNVEEAPVRRRPLNWGFILRPPRLDIAELWENSTYFLFGRHTGLFLYLPFAVLAVLFFFVELSRDLTRWLILITLVGLAFYFLLFIPVNWQGGGGFLGNRYYINAYPAFLFLVKRIRVPSLLVIGFASAGLFLGPMLLTPFGSVVPEPTLQAHARSAPFELFPLELSLKNVPGYHRLRLDGGRMIVRQDQAAPRGSSLWLRADDEVELLIESGEPLERPTFLLRSPVTKNVILRIDGHQTAIGFEPDRLEQKITLDAGKPYRVRSRGDLRSYVYRLRVSTRDGKLVTYSRRVGKSRCASFPQNEVEPATFFLGLELSLLGDAKDLEQEQYAVGWGQVSAPARVEPGEEFSATVEVKNQSPHRWRSTWGAQIGVAYHWLDDEGRVVLKDGLRTPLGGTVEPSEVITLQPRILAPKERGTYLLELDLVQEFVAWFSDRGATTYRLPVEVGDASGNEADEASP